VPGRPAPRMLDARLLLSGQNHQIFDHQKGFDRIKKKSLELAGKASVGDLAMPAASSSRSRSPSANRKPRSRSPSATRKPRSRTPPRKRSKSPLQRRRDSRSPAKRRSRTPPRRRSRSPKRRDSPPKRDRYDSRSPKRKRSRSRSPGGKADEDPLASYRQEPPLRFLPQTGGRKSLLPRSFSIGSLPLGGPFRATHTPPRPIPGLKTLDPCTS